MHRALMLCAVATVGCGGIDTPASPGRHAPAGATAAPAGAEPPGAAAAHARASTAGLPPSVATAAQSPAVPAPPGARKATNEPLPCPVASSRVGIATRTVLKPDGTQATFDQPDPEGPPGWPRAFACAKDGRIANAWTDEDFRLHLQLDGHTSILARDPREQELTMALAFDPHGALLVVWAETGRVRALMVSRSGRRGRAVTLGQASDSSVVGAEIADSGCAVVAWTTQDLGEERNQPHVVRAAFRAPGKTFARARVIDPGQGVDPEQVGHDPQSTLRLAVAPDGRALLMWGALTKAERHPVRLATASPTGRFGHIATLTPDGFPGDVALSKQGTPALIWRDGEQLLARVGDAKITLDRDRSTNDYSAAWPHGHAELGWSAPGGHLVATP